MAKTDSYHSHPRARRSLEEIATLIFWCPPGTFLIGRPESEEGRRDDETQHEVTLTQGFWIAKTHVTQGQWQMSECARACPPCLRLG